MRNNLILAMAYVFLTIKLSFLSTISIAQPEGALAIIVPG